MTFTFAAAVAWDPIGKQAVKNTSFQVYTQADTGFTTPLTITDTFGATLPGNILNSGTQGVFPEFEQVANSTVVITDPTRTYVWTITAVMQDSSVAAYVGTTGSATALAVKSEVTAGATAAALNATFVPRWKTATVYAIGDKTVSPNGDTVTANAAHTSAAAFATDTAKWDLSTSYATPATAQGIALVQALIYGA